VNPNEANEPITSPIYNNAPLYVPPPKKKHTVLWIILAVLMAAILCAIGTTIIALTSNTKTPPPNKNQVIEAPSPTAAKSVAPKKWQTVISLSGNGNKRSGYFHLGDGDKRMIYQITGGEFSIGGIYVLRKGLDLKKDGGIPDIDWTGPTKDTTAMIEDAGDYYLDIEAANSKWSVTIQELK